MWKHSDSYQDRLQTMLRGMLNQGLGHASGPHSSFIPYHVDAITLQPFGNGWQDEMAMGRVIESTFRSLNNLLEHLHQSFFFYLLMQANRFVSIGTYLPSAMLVAVNFTIMAIFLWIKSGTPLPLKGKVASTETGEKRQLVVVEKGDAKALVPQDALTVRERELLLPLAIVAGSQFLGVVPLYIFNHTAQSVSHCSRFQLLDLTSIDALNRVRHLRYPQQLPISHPLYPPNQSFQTNASTVPAHQIILPPTSRHVPLLARHPEFLSCLPRRPSLLAIDLDSARSKPANHQGHFSDPVGSHQSDCGAGRCKLGLGVGNWRGTEGSCVWLGCLGDEYAGCGVVRLVAHVACRWSITLGEAR